MVQYDRVSLVSQASSNALATDDNRRSDLVYDLEIAAYVLSPRYFEITLKGPDLPTRLHARLGPINTVMFPREGRAADGADMKVYSKVLSEPLTVTRLERALPTESITPSDPNYAGTAEVRRGDANGRLLAHGPEYFDCADTSELVAGALEITGVTVEGWAYDTAAPQETIALSLYADPDDDADPITTGLANRQNPTFASKYGASQSSFLLALPSDVLDGSPHDLTLRAQFDGREQTIWAQSYTCTQAHFEHAIVECDTEKELATLLHHFVSAERLELLECFFKDLWLKANVVLEDSSALAILGQIVIGAGDDPQDTITKALAQRFEILLGRVHNSETKIDILSAAVEKLLSAPGQAIRLQRYPHSPLAEVVTDLALCARADNTSEKGLRRLAELALQSGRLDLALDLVKQLLKAAPQDTDALLMAGKIGLAADDLNAAEAHLRLALHHRPGHSQALYQLARVASKRGAPLIAASLLSRGKGLTNWHSQAPAYDVSKIIAALDWAGLNARIAKRHNRSDYIDHLNRQADLAGPAPDLGTQGFSVFVRSTIPFQDTAQIFGALRPGGCQQITQCQAEHLADFECTGLWALVLNKEIVSDVSDWLTPEMIEDLFSQMRGYEVAARLMRGSEAEDGIFEHFDEAGFIVRQDVLRRHGALAPDAFYDATQTDIAWKTLLI